MNMRSSRPSVALVIAAVLLLAPASGSATTDPQAVTFRNCTSQLALLPVAPALVNPLLPPGFTSDGFVYTHAIACEAIEVGTEQVSQAVTKWFTAGVVPPADLADAGVDSFLVPLIGVSPQPSLASVLSGCGLRHIGPGAVTIAQDLEAGAAHVWEAEANAAGADFAFRTTAVSGGGSPGLERKLRFFGIQDDGRVAGFMTVRLPADPIGLGVAVAHLEGADSPLGDATLAGAVIHASGLTITGTCQTL